MNHASARVVKGMALLAGMAFLGHLSSAVDAAAETRKCRVTSYLNVMHAMPVVFAKAPASAIFERRGLARCENGATALYLMRGSGKFTPKGGAVEGHSLYTWEDGATSVVKWEAKLAKLENQQQEVSGTGAYVAGTGRLEGIQGEVSFTGRILAPFSEAEGTRGEAYFDVTSDYTLPTR